MDKDPITTAIESYAQAEAVYAQAKEQYTSARQTLLNLVPKEVGKFEVDAGKWHVDVEYPEKIKWDSEALDAIYGEDKPLYVKASYSIDLRALRKLSDAERTQLEKVYEVVPGTPKIAVEVV